MGQFRWHVWLMGAVTFLLGNASGTASSSHSLLHFRLAVLLEREPQFVEVTYLDSQPIQHYDSNTGRMRPLTLWINQTLNEGYWNMESSIVRNIVERSFLEKLEELLLPKKHNQSKDHILQCIKGCKLTADGKEIKIHQDVIDGKEMKGKKFHEERYYLDGNCIWWLKRFLDMKPEKKGVTEHPTFCPNGRRELSRAEKQLIKSLATTEHEEVRGERRKQPIQEFTAYEKLSSLTEMFLFQEEGPPVRLQSSEEFEPYGLPD